VKAHLSLLHIAPNMNEYLYVKKVFTSMIRYDRLDIKNRKQINIIDDITKPQKLQGNYDLIIVWHVFEHIKDDLKAISELFKVLTPGGNLLVSVPIYPLGNLVTYEDEAILRNNYKSVHGHYDHCRSCGLDYYQRFENLGFKTQTLAVDSIISEDILRFGLQDDHVVWRFTKPIDAI
jgi:2-polyprenyl-3-methyl-5-hydroxy-6-metoxy-1,4-benzoquinol methylase